MRVHQRRQQEAIGAFFGGFRVQAQEIRAPPDREVIRRIAQTVRIAALAEFQIPSP
jgi:hypothetical protein